MKATSLKRAIEARGGTAQIEIHASTPERGIPHTKTKVSGILNGHDVEMHDDDSTYFTARPVSKRGHYDPGSDYNSGGYSFYRRIKDLDCLARRVAA